jgi:hypothetical protein
MDLSVNFRRAQLLGGGAIGAAGHWIHPHLCPPLPERLNPATKEGPQKVHPRQPLLPQQLKGLAQGYNFPSQAISPGGHGSGATTGKHGERSGSIIECHEGHHVSLRRRKECRVLWHTASHELRRRHKPLLHKFLQMARRNNGRSPILLRYDSRRKGEPHL